MAVYHQMGHNSRNLLNEPCLDRFVGAILSPVNEDLASIESLVQEHQGPQFELLFDPQLYFPRSNRLCLNDWSYFPDDVDTADLSQLAWWQNVNTSLAAVVNSVGVSSLCSPVAAARTYTNQYYALCVDVCRDLAQRVAQAEVLQTVLIDYDQLSLPTRPLEIATIVSRTPANRCYVIVHSDIPPRRELGDETCLRGALDLIQALEESGLSTIVGYTSTDIVLWKYAGASATATGKFFNLRRFSPGRWDDPSPGGGQLPYWTEPSLMAFLREGDLDRVADAGFLPTASCTSEPAAAIVRNRADNPGEAWLGMSWRQYMNWFQEFDHLHPSPFVQADAFLAACETAWRALNNAGVLMEEMDNDGSWLRKWRLAIRSSRRWAATSTQ